jgi:predicted regulator of Ras-like GTPase activity (Roadblock/LC7/MglB family)
VTGNRGASLADRMHAELLHIRERVGGVYGTLVATSDGFLVAHDVPDLEPTEIAALVATTRALSARTTTAAGRGGFREAVARGTHGYLAVYAAGDRAIVAVIGSSQLNIAMLHYHVREIVERIAAQTATFETLTASAIVGAPVEVGLVPEVAGEHPGRVASLPRRKATAD